MKIDKTPLLKEGFQEISLYQLDKFFLDPFKNKERRVHLIGKLRLFLDAFASLHLAAEIWLDGSFTTTKEDPEDVDLVFLLDEKEVDALDGEKSGIFQKLMMDRIKTRIRYSCDVYFCDRSNEADRNYYMNLFGYEKDKRNKKGIFKIILPQG